MAVMDLAMGSAAVGRNAFEGGKLQNPFTAYLC